MNTEETRIHICIKNRAIFEVYLRRALSLTVPIRPTRGYSYKLSSTPVFHANNTCACVGDRGILVTRATHLAKQNKINNSSWDSLHWKTVSQKVVSSHLLGCKTRALRVGILNHRLPFFYYYCYQTFNDSRTSLVCKLQVDKIIETFSIR